MPPTLTGNPPSASAPEPLSPPMFMKLVDGDGERAAAGHEIGRRPARLTCATVSVPALRLVSPVYVLATFIRSVPEPSLVIEPVPPIAWLSVSVEPDVETSNPPSKVDQLTLLVASDVIAVPLVRRMPPAKVMAAVDPPMLESAEICSEPPSSRVPPV